MYVATTEAASGDAFRGIAFEESSGNFFVADYPSGQIMEFTPEGELVTSFTGAAPNQLNAVAVHKLDGTLWVATFNQGISHFERDGTQLGHFDTPFFITGLAIDEAAETLLVMESTNDFVREFNFSGQHLGIAIGINIIPDNGQGLAYDAYTATLYATTQTGPSRLTIFQDPERETLDAATPPCAGDCDDNGTFNKLDFICFMNAWKAREESADCNGDGAFNILDFVCFQNAWITQCGESEATWRPKRGDFRRFKRHVRGHKRASRCRR